MMTKKISLLLALFCVLTGHAIGQSITGTVLDSENSDPIPGVNIVVVSSGSGTITNMDGEFELDLGQESANVRFSFIGYDNFILEAQAGENYTINLVPSDMMLDDVVVVGYGSQRKENLTGAVSSIDVEKAISSRPVTDVGKALQGISPGLTITNQQGGVGTESTIRLRGSTGSLNASGGTSPLILVDNVEIPSLNLVNPDDIAEISVLKDAASAAIYGTRATWGVILITTKKGSKDDKVRVTYRNNIAWNTPTMMPEQTSAYENAKVLLDIAERTSGANSISSIGYNVDQEALGKIKDWEEQYGHMSQNELGEMQMGRDFEIRGGKTYFYRSFDPFKEFTRKWTPQQSHNFSVNGGSDKSTFNVSFGYLEQSGVMKENTDTYERYNFSTNVTTQVRDWWEVKTGVLLTRSTETQPYRFTSGLYDAWYYLLRWPRWYPYADYEDKPFRSAVTDMKYANDESDTQNYGRLNLGSIFTPIDGMSINVDYTFSLLNKNLRRNGGTIMAYNMFTANPTENYGDIYGQTHDRVIESSRYTVSNVFKAYGTYEFDLNDQHNFKVMAGMDAEDRRNFSHYSEARGLIDPTTPAIKLTTGDEYARNSTYAYDYEFASAGAFARFNYDFQQKYLVEVNGRYDGSSRFPEGDKWAFFPSASVGWRVTEEPFMDFTDPVLSDLKIRGSWGTIGNQDVAANSFLSTMSNSPSSGWVMDGGQIPYITSPTIISPSLTWERVSTLDIGLDARFFRNKMGVVFDWYKRTTTDMHSPGETLPASFGASSPLRNYGELEGKGYEIMLDFNHQFSNGLQMSLRAGFSDVKEEIVKYSNSIENIYSNYEGKELGEIWGYETDRLFQESDFVNGEMREGIASQSLFESGAFQYGPGDVKYQDLNGDGEINYGSNTLDDHGDLRVIGNTRPRYEYSFGLDLAWKGFDFSTFFQGVGQRDIWAIGSIAIPSFIDNEAYYDHFMDYWTPENTDAFYPRPASHSWVSNGRNFLRQSRYLLDLSYLRCKNMTLGYTLPRQLVSRASFEQVRVYVSGENLFEFTDAHLPVDPESTENKNGNTSGFSFGRSYPYSRTISCGVQISF
ncbi:TonB-dependent receptor [Marinilabilia salmonicolor]|uniref:TonB-linked SusC/RagA family outer membrane protein n=1 Tax=Marinilabilia salmonicolor TaxID=989 RepID=A0A2T0XLQ9_9BACT|nr:TonB-dependent receptor [Marinilabilia salmonicolor]PRY99865.1 TonB-linked SusC/RagA family outer membrane protein [Marinilabilia salmonicolor]RCW37337.1 TonB-linked SusC/RagA family outer membrane protein [Marinilabilia salmonicolor]